MKAALLSLFILCGTARAQSNSDIASQVDPFIGTSLSPVQDNGNTLPGAVRPFGMLDWSPDRADGTFYRYEGTDSRGFSLTHLSGAGCGAYGDVPILPILGPVNAPPPQRPQAYVAHYKSEDQIAQPGYFAVKLDGGIGVQLAAATRSGIAEFDFASSKETRSIVIDLSRNLTRVNDAEVEVGKRTVTGSVESDEFCGNENHYRIFFAIEVDQDPHSSGTFNELRVTSGSEREHSPRAGAFLSFSPTVSTIHLKVGISYVSVTNAALNLKHEIPGWDFEKVRKDARADWNDALRHVRVEGNTEAQHRVFYTALYHALLYPSVFSDVNGDYAGFDGKVHRKKEGLQYANYSGWDIYRCQVQLIAMLFPKVASDMAQSLVLDAEQGGGLPIWPVANDESSVMVGDPSDPILASIYAFGAHDFDTRAALAAMLKGADDPQTHIRLYPERTGLEDYLSKGYVPQRAEISGTAGAASVTLEDTSADFAISQFAKALGDTPTAQRFLVRSANWRTLFDPESRYIRARNAEGDFLPNFSPAKSDGFVEGNAAQYTWMVPYDLHGLIEAIGGPEAAKARLDDYFSEYGRWTDTSGTSTPHFLIANEPSFGNPWIYNWTGQPRRTQEVVAKTLHDLFNDSRGGLPGNDDLGATSAWAVFASLGFFPEIPGVGGVTLNTPSFQAITLNMGGHELHIRAPGVPGKAYIQTVTLDGQAIRNYWLDWDQLHSSGVLEFSLSSIPVKETGDLPPSFAPIPR
jgi:predicted alpha-1,2-mannosidase